MGENGKLYQRHHLVDLEPHYSAHVSAMTTEGLHHKSDIAAELAWRDLAIERLRADLKNLQDVWLNSDVRDLKQQLAAARHDNKRLREDQSALAHRVAASVIDDLVQLARDAGKPWDVEGLLSYQCQFTDCDTDECAWLKRLEGTNDE